MGRAGSDGSRCDRTGLAQLTSVAEQWEEEEEEEEEQSCCREVERTELKCGQAE